MKFNTLFIAFTVIAMSQFSISCSDDNDSDGGGGSGYSNSTAKVFDGAEGCGKNATGGRGGAVYAVTSLEDGRDYSTQAPISGTLRWALEQPNAKQIVFRVAGTIKLKTPLSIGSNVTIFGQSAPGGGICIAPAEEFSGSDHLMNIEGDNVIVQFLRFRFGNTNNDCDAFNCIGRNNIMIDHCSFSWSTDECITAYGNRNFTLQWSLVYEGLNTDLKGNHGFGGIWGGENVSFHHNLIANQSNRCPRFDHDYVNTLKGPVDFANNVIYIVNNANGTYGGESANTTGTQRTINMVNNYYKYSSNVSGSVMGRILNPSTECGNCKNICETIVPGKFYITGNYVEGFDNKTSDNWSAVSPVEDRMKSLSPFAMSQELSKQTAKDAYTNVLAKAGASYARDAADARVVKEVTDNTGKTRSSLSSSDWPALSGSPVKDSDLDGIPDDWEDANGLNKNSRSDANNAAPSGRTYIEEYMSSLVKHLY